jgi:hypothetical protein
MISLLCYAPILQAQEPFVCEGQAFITFLNSARTASNLAFITRDYEEDTVNIEVQGIINTNLNSVGYRSTDNLIYGLNPTTRQLIRVDADLDMKVLRTLPINSSISFVAGDITPNGDFLVLIGGSTYDNEMVFVDLRDLAYPIRKTLNVNSNLVRLADIAFHPVTGDIYGFDDRGSRVVILDSSTGALKSTYSAVSPAHKLGSIYFDQYGVLWGYGREASNPQQQTLYEINLSSGELEKIAEGVATTGTDACSCPFTIDLLQSVSNPNSYSCREVEYEIEILNWSSSVIKDLTVESVLPSGFEILEVQNPFGGTIVSGIGSNKLRIEGLTVPIGTDTIRFRVYLNQVEGFFKSQAILINVPDLMGGDKLSDDPRTKAEKDPTAITVSKEFPSIVIEHDTIICEGESVVLRTSANGLTVHWSTGTTSSQISVSESGLYEAWYSTECADTTREIFSVELDSVRIAIRDPSYTFKLGFPLVVDGIVLHNIGAVNHFNWWSEKSFFSCTDCQSTIITETKGGQVRLILSNERGCSDTAYAEILLQDYDSFYIPNAFSPNGDGTNDVFYVYGEGYKINYFVIYDQWGHIQFEFAPGSYSGLPANSWNGMEFHESDLFSNVFIYMGELEDLEGRKYPVSGTITLVR